MLYMSEAFPAALRGLRVSLAGEALTLGEWFEEATLRPLVRRTARCRLPEDLTLDPGSPRLWLLRLPTAAVVTRTGGAREGLAVRGHWAPLATRVACMSWPPSVSPKTFNLLCASVFLLIPTAESLSARLWCPAHVDFRLPSSLPIPTPALLLLPGGWMVGW